MTQIPNMAAPPAANIEFWPIDRFVDYARNPRKNEGVPVDRMVASIREFGIFGASLSARVK